jgi:tetratricopeptide (TPR) repeat protein
MLKKKLFPAAIALLSMTWGCNQPAMSKLGQPNPVSLCRRHVKSAVSALKENRTKMALFLFSKALAIKEKASLLLDLSVAEYNMGLIYLTQNKLHDAENAFRSAVSNPRIRADAWVGLSRVFERDGRRKDSIELLEASFSKEPFSSKIAHALQRLYRLDGQHKKARNTAFRALAERPDDISTYRNLALLSMKKKKLDEAETILKAALTLSEKNRPAFKKESALIINDLGVVYCKMGRYALGAVTFSKAIELNPKLSVALQNLAAVAHRFRDYPRVLSAYQRLCVIRPLRRADLVGKAFALIGMGQTKKSLPLLKQMTDSDEVPKRVYEALGDIYERHHRDYPKALQCFCKENDLFPGPSIKRKIARIKSKIKAEP